MPNHLLALVAIMFLNACGPIDIGDGEEEDCTECSDSGTDSADSGEADADTDADTDADSDADSDADTDSGVSSDADGDGYDDAPEDCDDSDPAVNPGADEACNDIDDDCDGDIDEGCDEEEISELSASADYTSSHDLLEINIQPIWDVSEIGDWWWDSETAPNDDEVTWSAEDDFEGILGVRLNTTVYEDTDNNGGYDTYDWYCYGHYSTAELDPTVSIDIEVDGVWYDADDLVTWSPGESTETSLGCSALLWFGDTSTITDGAVY